jgi:hypothetical protein
MANDGNLPMKPEVLLGWLSELETTITGDACLLRRDAPANADAVDIDDWRVFAALAAVPLRKADEPLSPPS